MLSSNNVIITYNFISDLSRYHINNNNKKKTEYK